MKKIIFIFCFSFLLLSCSNQTNNSNDSLSSSNISNENVASINSANNETNSEISDLAKQVNRINSEGSSDEQIAQNIADVDKSITYEQLKKNASKYVGKPWAFKGKILQIQEKDGRTFALVTLNEWQQKNVWVDGDLITDFVDNQQVYVVGYLAGDKSYTSIQNWQITIPSLAIRAMIKPSEVSKYKIKTDKK